MKAKICIICNKEYMPKISFAKCCSFECSKINKSNLDKIYKDKQKETYWCVKTTIYKHKCSVCEKEYDSVNKKQKFCSRSCFAIDMKESRKWESNPAYRNWMYSYSDWDRKTKVNTVQRKDKEFIKTSKELRQNQIDNVWYNYCMKCNRSDMWILHSHHIVYRSEAPKHANLHNKRNLILVCNQCHNNYHSNKESRTQLVIERKLRELFPVYIKEQYFV